MIGRVCLFVSYIVRSDASCCRSGCDSVLLHGGLAEVSAARKRLRGSGLPIFRVGLPFGSI